MSQEESVKKELTLDEKLDQLLQGQNILFKRQDAVESAMIIWNDNFEKLSAGLDAKIDRRFAGVQQLAAEVKPTSQTQAEAPKSKGMLGGMYDMLKDKEMREGLKGLAKDLGFLGENPDNSTVLSIDLKEIFGPVSRSVLKNKMKEGIIESFNINTGPAHVNLNELNHGNT